MYCTMYMLHVYIYVQVEEQGGVLDRDMGNYVLEDTRLSTLQKKLTKELFILIFSFWGLYKPFKIKTFFSQKKKEFYLLFSPLYNVRGRTVLRIRVYIHWIRNIANTNYTYYIYYTIFILAKYEKVSGDEKLIFSFSI